MTVFLQPKSGGKATKVGGDSSVERDGLGRPRIIVGCDNCDGSGTVPSPKTGKGIKCQTCKGEGVDRKVSYTRVTTYIDVLDDKSALGTWKARKVLQGVAADTSLLEGVNATTDEEREGRDWLNRRAEVAAEHAGASKKSEDGTRLHDLSEHVDNGTPVFALDATLADRADLAAYESATKGVVNVELMEKLMVQDDLKVAGTPDRVSHPSVPLTAPDGSVISDDELIITDLKTGRIDYGSLKMAMQLSIYSRSQLYMRNGSRVSLEGLRTDWGLIMHLPVGSAVCTIYWVDLDAGWNAVQLATQVRAVRKVKPLTPVFG